MFSSTTASYLLKLTGVAVISLSTPKLSVSVTVIFLSSMSSVIFSIVNKYVSSTGYSLLLFWIPTVIGSIVILSFKLTSWFNSPL